MDPNAALTNLRDATGLASALRDGDPIDYTAEQILADLAEAAEALDGWLSKGGFLPDAWARPDEFVLTPTGFKRAPATEEEGPRPLVCRNCGLTLHQRPEKALSGETQMVWADDTDAWVCSFTGNEHLPGVRA